MHEGHRQRMKQKFISSGIDGYESHEVLELLLYYSIPRKDTNEIAHRLLDHFGSFSAVLDAPIDTLSEIEGVGENTAVLLKLVPSLCRLYLDDKYRNIKKIISLDNVGDFLLNKFIGRTNETVYLLLMDNKFRELYCGIVNEGSVNSVDIYVRKIVELAMRYNASQAVLAHNHPSGIALPSNSDISTTISIKNALELVGVRLVDHIIVADDDYVSLAQSHLSEHLF